MAASSLDTQIEELLSEDPASAVERERSTFKEITASSRQFVLFGAGGLGRKALRVLRHHGIEPLAFTDSNASLWGKEIEGLKVLSPVNAAETFGRSAAFLVAAFRDGVDFVQIRQQLSQLSCTKVVSFLPLLWAYPRECLPHASTELPHKILRQKEEVLRAFFLLSDATSRREYVAHLRFRLLGDFDAMPPPLSANDEYFPEDLFALMPGEVFVDCGAFDGDTVRAFLERQKEFKRIVALEADPINFARLQAYVSNLPPSIRERTCVQHVAVGGQKGKIRIEPTGTASSKASDQGSVEVDCVSLDDLLGGSPHPTYVKMDIEGAESDALRGARRTLEQSRAIWGVCVYHNADDLWRLPLYLDGHLRDYRLFLRRYLEEIWDTVCYAVPIERVKTTEA